MPIIFGPLAGVVALGTAWRLEAMTLRFFWIVSWMSIAIGGLGLYSHGVAVWHRLGGLHDLVDWPKLLAVPRYAPPLGAPAAFVGMGALGLLAHTCVLKLETILAPSAGRRAKPQRPIPLAYALFGLTFVLLVAAPFVPVVLHWVF